MILIFWKQNKSPDFCENRRKTKKILKNFKICLTPCGTFLYKGRLGNDIACRCPLKKTGFSKKKLLI